MFVSVYFKMCLYLGSGLADTKVSVCTNVPMSSRPTQFMLLIEMFLRVFGSAHGLNDDHLQLIGQV